MLCKQIVHLNEELINEMPFVSDSTIAMVDVSAGPSLD
jgi:hypothetical protein